MREGIETSLAEALSNQATPCSEGPVDPVELAEYLDGVLEPRRREALEAHLAGCPSCRRWMTEAGLAIASQESAPETEPLAFPSPTPADAVARHHRARRHPARRWLPLAAMLAGLALAGLALSQWRQAQVATHLSALGVDAEAVRRLGGGQQERLDNALAGKIATEIRYFDDLLDSRQQSTLRRASLTDGPRPVAPHWSASLSRQPGFAWYPPAADDGRSQGEILIVDTGEAVVGAFEFDLEIASPDLPLQLPWPKELPPLAEDRTYAWKVNTLRNGEWRSSEYVPFRVLSETGVEERLELVKDVPFLEAVEMAALGLYDPALEALARASTGAGEVAILTRLAVAILERKRLDDALADKELERWRSEAGLDPVP